jgi:hypothetical protein
MRSLNFLHSRLSALAARASTPDDGCDNSEQMSRRAAQLLAEVDPAAEVQRFNPAECSAAELALLQTSNAAAQSAALQQVSPSVKPQSTLARSGQTAANPPA